jgi:hypothetical protein
MQPAIYSNAGGGGGGGFALAWQSTATSNANTATINYGTMTWQSGQYLVMGLAFIANNPASTVSSVTVDGISLAQISGALETRGAFGPVADMWISPSPMVHSAGNVSVTYSASPNSFGVAAAVAVYSLSTTTPAAASAGGAVFNSGTNPFTFSTLAVPSGGGAIVIVATDSGTFSSWTGAASDSSPTPGAGISPNFGHTTATGTNTISATWTANASGVITGVAWGP